VMEPADLSGYVVTLGQHLLQDGMGIILSEEGMQTGGPTGSRYSGSRG